MKLVLERIHGNSKSNWAGYAFGKQITIINEIYDVKRENFTELYNFFTHALGPAVDIDTEQTLYPTPKQVWTYQLDPKYQQHRFFIKSKEHLDWFLLKYSSKLTHWTR